MSSACSAPRRWCWSSRCGISAFPAILKGYFDRVFLPGVSLDIVDGDVRGMLTNITRLVAVTTYGGTFTGPSWPATRRAASSAAPSAP